MGDRWTGFAAMAAGLTLASIGAVGSFAASDDGPSTTEASAPAPKEPDDRGPRPRKPAPDETETVVQETPEEFYALWEAALKTNDAAFLFERLHPLVVDRYGAKQCRTFAGSISQPDFDVEVVRVGAAEPFVYETDGISGTLSSAIPVRIRLTSAGTTTAQLAHLAYVGDVLHWFTDCGEPR